MTQAAQKLLSNTHKNSALPHYAKPSREQAEEAVRTLIAWAGDHPLREGLLDTPARVARPYEEFFSGYTQDPEDFLARTFEEIGGYRDMVLVKNIRVESHCEHHMVPIIGKAHIAYIPDQRIVGLSKLARVAELYFKRLQTQEVMTVEIADAIDRVLKPKGVAVVIEAAHLCMTTRGVNQPGTVTTTSKMSGEFETNPATFHKFMAMLGMAAM
jgi:GTP cyclohydrolase I